MPSGNRIGKWDDLTRFQLNIAERWLERGNRFDDMFARFFFYFAGFNALYFLWTKIDDLRSTEGGDPGEEKQITNLLKKFPQNSAEQVLRTNQPDTDYFIQRRPIQRMSKRTWDKPFEGDQSEGKRWQRKLMSEAASLDRLAALGHMLYLVRSNLFHGSKAESGDDGVVIEHSVGPLRAILMEAISMTQRAQNGGVV